MRRHATTTGCHNGSRSTRPLPGTQLSRKRGDWEMVFQRLCAARCVGAGRAGGEPSGRRRLRSHECVLGLIILAAALGRLALFILAPNIESPDTASYFASGNALFAT